MIGFLAVLSELLIEGTKCTSGELRGESKIARALHESLHPLPKTTSTSTSTLSVLSSTSNKGLSKKVTSNQMSRDSKKRKIEEKVVGSIPVGNYSNFTEGREDSSGFSFLWGNRK